jgi:hypothetical protein
VTVVNYVGVHMMVRRMIGSAGPIVAAVCALLALATAPAQAQGDADSNSKWLGKTLKCDGFDDNRCYRYVDPRRRGKPYLKTPRPPAYVDNGPSHYFPYQRRYHAWRFQHRPHYEKYYHRTYHHHPHYRHRPYYARYDRGDYRDRDRDRDYDRYEGYGPRSWRWERQCLRMITVKGTEAQTENGALISAKRAWRAWVRADYGERYQELDNAKAAEYRCWRSSTNESVVGRAGEWLTGQYRKRCQVWAVPCLGERQRLEGDKDDRE